MGEGGLCHLMIVVKRHRCLERQDFGIQVLNSNGVCVDSKAVSNE